MKHEDVTWVLICLGALALVGVTPLLLLLGPFSRPDDVAGHLSAVLIFVGGLVIAGISFIRVTVSRESGRRLSLQQEDQEARLRIEAATQAGALFSPLSGPAHPLPPSVASSLLSLTRLDRADLAVALLVDYWAADDSDILTEVAILVIDAALRSFLPPNAQLVAAKILCRNSTRLDSCESLQWPSCIDGCWDTNFGPRTKLLLIEALVNMTLAKPVTEGSLRAVSVRLYGIYKGDLEEHVRGCIGKMICALVPTLERLDYTNFMQGPVNVMLNDLKDAANHKQDNPDDYLNRMANHRYEKLKAWAERLPGKELKDVPLGQITVNPVPVGRVSD
jgi:hypothetical protein